MNKIKTNGYYMQEIESVYSEDKQCFNSVHYYYSPKKYQLDCSVCDSHCLFVPQNALNLYIYSQLHFSRSHRVCVFAWFFFHPVYKIMAWNVSKKIIPLNIVILLLNKKKDTNNIKTTTTWPLFTSTALLWILFRNSLWHFAFHFEKCWNAHSI